MSNKSVLDFCKNSSFMRWSLKRRRIVSIAAILCICFLIYQLLSLKELNIQMSISLTQKGPKLMSKHQTNDHSIVQNDGINQIESNINIITDKHMNTKGSDGQRSAHKVVIFGVLPKFTDLYLKTSDIFRCLVSGEEIPYNHLNDDYCDCVDGTDEPSTNACPHNKFFCDNVLETDRHYISMAKVNDGICDCCDGTDENKSISSPIKLTRSQMETIKSSNRIVGTVPCPNRCVHSSLT